MGGQWWGAPLAHFEFKYGQRERAREDEEQVGGLDLFGWEVDLDTGGFGRGDGIDGNGNGRGGDRDGRRGRDGGGDGFGHGRGDGSGEWRGRHFFRHLHTPSPSRCCPYHLGHIVRPDHCTRPLDLQQQRLRIWSQNG